MVGDYELPPDAGVMAAADALMERAAQSGLIWLDWQNWAEGKGVRDAIYAALLSERQRGREEMRDRAEKVAARRGGFTAGAIADEIRSLSTED